MDEIHEQNITFPDNEYDFFPYADEPGEYWTGYYTSKPIFKKQVRDAGKFLQTARKFISIN